MSSAAQHTGRRCSTRVICVMLISCTAPIVFMHRTSQSKTREHAVPCKSISVKYKSSKLEESWLQNAANWSASYCDAVSQFETAMLEWLKMVAQNQNATTWNGSSNNAIFSNYQHVIQCGNVRKVHTTYIEPLSHGLRHPNSICNNSVNIVDRSYLMVAFIDDVRGTMRECAGRRCQKLYFDVGASTWNTGAGGPSQEWFTNTYRNHGIEFDRFLLWEANPLNPKLIFENLPKELWHKYQYFNIPASSNIASASSPIRLLKVIAQPDDFVLFKLEDRKSVV